MRERREGKKKTTHRSTWLDSLATTRKLRAGRTALGGPRWEDRGKVPRDGIKLPVSLMNEREGEKEEWQSELLHQKVTEEFYGFPGREQDGQQPNDEHCDRNGVLKEMSGATRHGERYIRLGESSNFPSSHLPDRRTFTGKSLARAGIFFAFSLRVYWWIPLPEIIRIRDLVPEKMSGREQTRSFFKNHLFQIGATLIAVSLVLIFALFLAIRFRWIDVVALGLSDGIDGIGGALAPLYLAFYAAAGLLALGAVILAIVLILGIRTHAEKLSALPVYMGEKERKRLTDLIAGFIDGTCGPYDWDWVIMTGPKESQEAERVSSLCASLDALHPPKEKGHFTDDAGFIVLGELVELLRATSASDTRVFEFVDEAFKAVDGTENCGAGPRRV